MGKLFREGLEKLKENHTMIREIRGKGLMIGIEIKFEVKDILMGLIKKGVLIAIFWKKYSKNYYPH